MENIWSSEIDSILSVGRTLDSVGVRNWALEREAALAALEQLSAIKVAVLGGDVYAVNGANVESNYDNWYCNRDGGEADADFVERSIAKARSYITNYRANAGSVLFAIVPSVVLK
ncbi:Imm40 family immunity protein [Chitinivorax sp. PXF-14]|uniref:Imm40 family immunity protein n=1 Tax=Chitinivorax sp. PXF-14 TaxID=3230488 RepID=UPI003465B1F8